MALLTQSSSEDAINQANLAMRSQPWYQDWFRARGLNPNQVRLSEGQRNELSDLAAQNGFSLGARMKFDEAGNINQKGGWAGMSPAMKAIIGGGVTAASMGLIPGVPGIGSLFGGGSSMTEPALGSLDQFVNAANAQQLAGLPTLASHSIGTGLGVGPSVGGAAAGAGGGVNSLLSRFLQPQSLADIGSMFGAMGDSEAANRINNSNTSLAQGRLALDAQQDRRTQESDALKKLSQASYIKSGGAPFDASQIKLANGRELPQFNFPRAPISDAMKQGAGDLETQLLNRLKADGSGSYSAPSADDLTRRGTMEQIGNIGGIISSGVGAASKGGYLPAIGKGLKSVWDYFT